MSITHCPLCIGLAVLCVVRSAAHGVMLWQWRRQESQAALRLQGA